MKNRNTILTTMLFALQRDVTQRVPQEHKKVQEQQSMIDELKSTVARQQNEMETVIACVKEQAAQIQKVSAQMETSRPAPKVVLNNP